jgi:hypothetical protein
MPFEYMKAMAELWGRGGQDFAAAQQNFFANMAKAVGQESPSGVPRAGVFDPQSLTQANQAFAKLWSSAIAVRCCFIGPITCALDGRPGKEIKSAPQLSDTYVPSTFCSRPGLPELTGRGGADVLLISFCGGADEGHGCPVGRFGYFEVIHASDVPDNAVAGVVPNIHAKGEVRFGLHGQVRLDSSWPAGILPPCCCAA